MSNPPAVNRPVEGGDAALDLLKIEYEKAADRYDHIYQSIWTIFSYMSAVSAAFLAFGGERITPWAVASIAPLPLVFWYWSTYMPLDRYGNRTLSSLKKIEERAFSNFGAPLKHYSGFAREKHGLVSNFREKAKTCGLVCAVSDTIRRARFSIAVAFLCLHVFLVFAVCHWSQAGYKFFKDEPAAPIYHVQVDSALPVEVVRTPAVPGPTAAPASPLPSPQQPK